MASPKLEYAARTIRGKITKLLPEFLTDFPLVEKHPHTAKTAAEVSAAVTVKGTITGMLIKVNMLLQGEERSYVFIFLRHVQGLLGR